jgi:hypothetical protein
MDDCDGCLDSLAGGRPSPLSGNPPDDSNQNQDHRHVGRAMTFAATPPDFNQTSSHGTRGGVRTGDRSDTRQGSRFACVNPRDEHWLNNHSANNHEKWSTVVGQFPVIAPMNSTLAQKQEHGLFRRQFSP